MTVRTPEFVYNHLSISNAKARFSLNHSHSIYEIIFFEGGDADYVVEGRRYRLRKNDLVFTRPGTYHYIEVRSNVEYSRFNVAFDPAAVGESFLALVPENTEVVNCTESGIIAENFRRMDRYSRECSEVDFCALLSGLIREILYNLSVASSDSVHIPDVSPIISRAVEYVGENLFSMKSIREICEALSLSEPYLFKLFKSQLGISPKQYVNLKRMQHARELIRRGARPFEIYSDCGFETYVGFYKQYVKTFGHSPSQETDSQKRDLSSPEYSENDK